MLLLLPPSETKRDGGDPIALSLDALSFPSLRDARQRVLTATSELAADADAMMRALKLGPRQAAEVDRNRQLWTSPTMPALDRYTGVLYDALDAASLDPAARAYAAEHVAVHSALFGIVGAADRIPAYRLSHDSRLPDLRLKAQWREPIRGVLAGHPGLIVDLRSEGYVDLGPAPVRADSVFLRVVSVDSGGRRRALNHFNKRAKGSFTRALLEARPALETRDDLMEWCADAGFRLELGAERTAAPVELELVA
ncbi:YaaA family protein [Agromyces binzhouensis]|uniref:Peroxide stress protein YaaA n=1 Tax=Agromyces binzhouensis TaxID=1817495 RepID=A0A4Q2JW12_9MICO|nr:peroxide stress protein YaaA [Agromyces binzhouensis]RXZ51406.1 peroxide stress protein YaaA [Agromyces binzhouensis]